MKTKHPILKWFLMLLISVFTLSAWAQNQNPTQTVCLGEQPYYVDLSPISGAVYNWSVTIGGTIISGVGTQMITVNWTVVGGPYTLSVYTSANGCDGPVQSVAVTVVAEPIGPTLDAKMPIDASVCAGTNVSATFLPGSGGVDCTDVFEYRFDGGTWISYTPGADLSTTAHTLVDIRGQRGACTANAGCDGTPWVTLASWAVTPIPTAIITYEDSPFCFSLATPQAVTLVGTTGGTYTSTAGLTINSTTGEITPNTSTVGDYIVTYTIAASGGCAAVTATTPVSITTAPNANISYAGTPFCTSNALPQAVTRTGTAGGTYSSTAGLTINSTTGEITPSTSTAGDYVVTYTIAALGGCAEVIRTTNVTITNAPEATIAYDGSPFCADVVTGQLVTLTGTTGGIFTASPAGLTINSSTGTITPSTSVVGNYTVTYTIAASGGCSAVIETALVTINPIPVTSPIWHN